MQKVTIFYANDVIEQKKKIRKMKKIYIVYIYITQRHTHVYIIYIYIFRHI